MDQYQASRKILKESQNENFPIEMEAFGLSIQINEGVFSPKYFKGWEVFTRNFPSVTDKNILEIGTGSGITSLCLAKNGAKKVVASDINPSAVENTKINIAKNGLKNIEAREGDMFDPVSQDEKFDIIYWNMPFIKISEGYEYQSMLERGLFDPGYVITDKFLKEAKDYLSSNGYILLGTGDFGDIEELILLALKYDYKIELLVKEESKEINDVNFQLYKLIPDKSSGIKVFFAMPFTGKSFEEILIERESIHKKLEKRGISCLEQFVNIEDKEKFENHEHGIDFIVKKDEILIEKADVVIADFSTPSVGRDFEVVIAKRIYNKYVISIVPDHKQQKHPWIRTFSDIIVGDVDEAIQKISDLNIDKQ